MPTQTWPRNTIFFLFLLASSSLNADSFSGGTGWGKFVQVLLSVGTCQNQLLEAQRAACFKRNARQACQYAPEGIEKENCIKEYSGYSVTSDKSLSKSSSWSLPPLKGKMNHVSNIPAPFTKMKQKPQDSKPDEYDSRIRGLLYTP
ncbi:MULTISPECIES: hypothetical protein [unclassified Pseudomonas]|uniref:hypothetical protein n=1 Tax=unclassified Pseudomonas TaxID=196821 RepID=UPI0011AEC41E|nr:MULTISPECIES: hypothetical protein [unclassified Pseudomonas]UMZ09826.1 hypothetical protein I9018_20230 [Pseudomonas sp. MPFS]